MPRRSETSDTDHGGRRNPSRGKSRVAAYNEAASEADGDSAPMDVDVDDEDEKNPASSSETDESLNVDEDEDEPRRSRRSANAPTKKGKAAVKAVTGRGRARAESVPTRTSSRSTKFASSLAEPSGESIRDLLDGDSEYVKTGKSRKASGGNRTNRDSTDTAELSDVDEETTGETSTSRRKVLSKKGGVRDSLGAIGPTSPSKSPARRHSMNRHSLRQDEEASGDSEESSEEESEGEDEGEAIRIQRVLACRTEKLTKWREICQGINTSEIDTGSRWFQSSDENDDKKDDSSEDDTFEERFLVKWSDLSYLHCSWETRDDLIEQVEGAKTYLSTFFRKSESGVLFSADERCDGDYFDPAFTQIDRILEIQFSTDEDHPTLTAEDEDRYTASDFGIVMDKSAEEYEEGTGRQFLIKWSHTPYSECTFEFERDLILNETDYKDDVKGFLRRNKKPTKSDLRTRIRKGEEELRRSYKFFGDRSTISDEKRDECVQKYQQELQERVFPNGGQLRDYQAEGVSWMMSNFVNQRSSILADEMGLGKTLQTCATVNLIANRLNRVGPALIVAPLSTLAHWQREFNSWTGLNAIIYHGSAEDRRLIRMLEMAYECDRPQDGVGMNQLYLKKCGPKKFGKTETPWMAQVVITTPEMLVADDFKELTAVHWEILVVDEAHRLKNHNSKLAVNLRDEKFIFGHKLLLTGTPIQNDVKEFWTLLNFINPGDFDDIDAFLEKYGEIKSKEKIDELHEEIRTYILRRLKEDVEKSVPPKEETLIEVELTLAQKQYYRALYEKNIKFLHQNKKRALDGPSLNNLAMQLRKCCNHLFLLNGVEEDFRQKEANSGQTISEADFLVKASGKLVLLDKLLPRLKQEGHRVLVFSQFKIMLDILEDYFNCRSMKFERIDGSITGHRRQQAIDRFQAPSTDDRELPFVMMLSTRAGGVGINLTAADTCIIFDSDWNPQNDLQAQARCHRIGQTKKVKVYRLLTRKTYEMQMFHMSSLKMGLDQAVLNGFETGSSGEGSLSKEEVEKLLRHGAYDIFSEDAAGTAETESNDFVQQDIDSILLGRSRTVVHDNTGSASNAAGGTFSKARFKAAMTPDTAKGANAHEDIDIEDPDFWKKMIGEPDVEEDVDGPTSKRRNRKQTNYSERDYTKQLEATLTFDADNDSDSDSYADEGGDETSERSRWGGSSPSEWNKEHVESLIRTLLSFGYIIDWDPLMKSLDFRNETNGAETKRMSWSLLLLTILEAADDDASVAKKREERATEKKQEASGQQSEGVLAMDLSQNCIDEAQLKEKSFVRIWTANAAWAKSALEDAIAFAKDNAPRDADTLETSLAGSESQKPKQAGISSTFAENVWPSLKSRGWKAELSTEGPSAGKTRYTYGGKQYSSVESVLTAVREIHPELSTVADTLLNKVESSRRNDVESQERVRAKHLSLTSDSVSTEVLRSFLSQYAPIQLLVDRTQPNRIRLSRKLLSTCSFMQTASTLVRKAETSSGDTELIDRLASSLVVDKRTTLPHPLWTTKHDAVLVLAIAKHGWIDQEASCRAITDDSTVAWGPPFEASNGSGNSVAVTGSGGDISDLRATGIRAASIMNENHDVLEETKGFNANLVVRAYGLVRQTTETPANLESTNLHTWIVNDTALDAAGGGSSREYESVELPTKKDLVRRAKTVLMRSNGSVGEASTSAATPNSFGFSVLDQSEPCNILLAEIVRGIMKAPSNSTPCKHLCHLALKEAEIRLHAMQTSRSVSSDVATKPSKEADDMRRIAKQIEVVQRNLAKSARQCKNLVRVMLGEDPHQPRNSSEIMFPVEKAAPSALETMRVSGTNTTTKTSGEKAFELATKRAHTRNSEVDAETMIDLTEIETMILLIICSHGLPVWCDAGSSTSLGVSGASPAGSATHGAKHTITWLSVGRALTNLAQGYVRKAAEKARKAHKEFERAKEAEREKAQAIAVEAERVFVSKETAADQATEYAADPETLAKKTVMMLEKLRRHMGPVGVTPKSIIGAENGLGAKIMIWAGKEIERWAQSLQLVDDKNCPLAYTAVDFLEDIPEEERSGVEISTVFDKKGCRNVLSQIASVSRIRSVYVEYKYEDLIPKIEKANTNLIAAGDVWEQRPEWWGPPSQAQGSTGHDGLLLERLLTSGFDSVLESNENPSNYGQTFLCLPFKDFQLSKRSIQLRANQLARELHAMEEASNSFRILEERRNIHGSTHAQVAKKPAVSKKSSSGGTQTGLHSFFGTSIPTARTEVITIVDDDDDNVDAKAGGPVQANPKSCVMYSDVEVVVVPPPQGKRKGDGKAEEDDASPSPEKKHRAD